MRSFYRFLVICFAALLCITPPLPAEAEAVYIRTVAHDDTPLMQSRKQQCAYLIRLALDRGLTPDDTAALVRRHGFAACPDRVFWSPGAPYACLPTYRFTLGSGAGRNWWGLLCPAARDAFLCNEKDGVPHMDAADGSVVVFPLLGRLLRLLGL